MYLPEPERLAKMDATELSVWRSDGRKQRKVEKQRNKRREIRASKGESKHGLRYDPPGKCI